MVFWPKLPKFLVKLNFDFSLHNFSRYVIFRIFCNFFARKVLGDMARIRKALQTNGRTHGRTHGRTDGRTYTEGKTIYVSRRGRHIIQNSYKSMQDARQEKRVHIFISKYFQFGYYKLISEIRRNRDTEI